MRDRGDGMRRSPVRELNTQDAADTREFQNKGKSRCDIALGEGGNRSGRRRGGYSLHEVGSNVEGRHHANSGHWIMEEQARNQNVKAGERFFWTDSKAGPGAGILPCGG